MELSQKNQIRQEQHELDMARATNPPPVIQQGVQEPEVYRDVPSPSVYPEDNYQQQTSSGNSSGSSVGSHVATAAIGAAAGYVAGKYTSTPKGQQKVDLYKDKSKSMYNSTKQKAYTGYRFTKSKVTSKYRSFKKR